MKGLGLSLCALAIGATAVMPAGCGGSRPPIGARGATLQPGAALRKLRPLSGGALIYAFTNYARPKGVIFDYPSGKLITTFQTPMFGAGGACSDAQGNVFLSGSVLQSGNWVPGIEEYTYGFTTPSASVSIGPSGGTAASCSIDNTTGDVAAIIRRSAGGSYIAVFPQFQGPPKTYSFGTIGDPLSVGYDGSGDLFLLGLLKWYETDYALADLPKGGTGFNAVSLNLGKHVAFVTTVQWDGTHMTIKTTNKSPHVKGRPWPEAIYRLAISGSNAKVVDKSIFTGPRNNSGASWIQSNRNIVVVATGHLSIWAYPAGGKELKELHSGVGRTNVATVAVSGSDNRSRR